ncbi:hypothetical protein HDU97_003330 [Phlyctochytrium planicorne]|nr:hypothetical protein HDU97_003330 [Phlyctochytrium planicorne]
MKATLQLFGACILVALAILPSTLAEFQAHNCAGVQFIRSYRDQTSPDLRFSDRNMVFNWLWGSYWYLLDHNDDCSTHKVELSGTHIMSKVCINKIERERFKNMDAANCFIGQAAENYVSNFAFGAMTWFGDESKTSVPRFSLSNHGKQPSKIKFPNNSASFRSTQPFLTIFGTLALSILVSAPSVRANPTDCAGVKLHGAFADQKSPNNFKWTAGNYIYDSIWGCYWYLLDHNDFCSTHKFADSSGDEHMIEVCINQDVNNSRQRYKSMEAAQCFVGGATDAFVHQFAWGILEWSQLDPFYGFVSAAIYHCKDNPGRC